MSKGRKMPEYSTYIQAYVKKENQLAAKGYSMYDRMYTESEYKVYYKATLNSQKEEVKRGERKRTGMVIRDMVNDQAYKITKKQARAQQKAGKELGIKGSIQDYMANTTAFQEKMDERISELYAAGKTSSEVALIISQEYYGSM